VARLLFEPTTGVVAPPPDHALEQLPVPCNPALLTLACARRVLLLQGPVGPFFDRLTLWLRAQGADVHRVVFQAGDRHDSTAVVPMHFTGKPSGWPAFLEELLTSLDIDAVVLFGQSRPHHAAAIRTARACGVAAIVLEEGYIRPGYVTMELDGVNGFSSTLDRYRWKSDQAGLVVKTQKPASTERQFWQMAGFACRHYWAQHWGKPLSPDYQHHRPTSVWYHSKYWVWSTIRKHLHLARDNARVQDLREQKYFFVPLQHDGDAQITHHSPYPRVASFIPEVVHSFALHAPKQALLVFRLHPHSRGGPTHRQHIARLAETLGVADRVVYLVEGHTPTLVEHAQGVVLINSTVGLQALMRCKPLAVMGQALYKRPGLHFEGKLDQFWTEAQAPKPEQARQFLEQLLALTQVPCNVYGLANEPLQWITQAGQHIPGKAP
jgi:capsular polysaccharide export protein